MSGRVGSGQEASKISRVGSGRVGSGQVARCSKSHGSRRVRSVGWGREVSKSRNVWPSNYTGQLLAAGLSIRVFHQSASIIPCCILVVLPLTRSTKPGSADKGTFFKQA